MNSKIGKIIAVTSRKGGVGKTTMALNLAASYQQLNLKTLLVDLDLDSGGIALSLNVNCKKNIYDLVDDLKNNRYEAFEAYITTYQENIDVLSAPNDPREANRIDPEYIPKILDYAKYKYDVIILDTTHIINQLNLRILDTSHTNLYLITNDPVDLKNVKSMIKIYKETENDKYKIILNESRDTGKDYFSDFDIKNIIGTNIDYTISKSFYIKDIDKYILNGEILVTNKKIRLLHKKDCDKIMLIAKDMIAEKGGK